MSASRRQLVGAVFRLLAGLGLGVLVACASAPPAAPCFTVQGNPELRATDGTKLLDDLSRRIKLAPEEEALRTPGSIADVKAILHRDVVYLFVPAATFARGLDTTEGRFAEAQLELLLGESQLIASQVLSTQAAWVGADLRLARGFLAGEGHEPSTDRGRMLVQLVRAVEEGNKIADALGIVAPSHLTRGAEVVQKLRVEAPTDVRTSALVAEVHRLRGEWAEFDVAMRAAEAVDRSSRAVCYLRGMEQLERYRRPADGVQLLRGCLTAFPGFVRAQAGILVMSPNPSVGLRELDQLKAMNQDHYLVMLLEPTLAADRELQRMQNGGGSGSHDVER